MTNMHACSEEIIPQEAADMNNYTTLTHGVNVASLEVARPSVLL